MILLSHLGAPAIPGCPCECCEGDRSSTARAIASVQASAEFARWVCRVRESALGHCLDGQHCAACMASSENNECCKCDLKPEWLS